VVETEVTVGAVVSELLLELSVVLELSVSVVVELFVVVDSSRSTSSFLLQE
jgi:hypothetical protein